MPKITSPIVAYLQENIALHRRLNAGLRLAQDENDALTLLPTFVGVFPC